MSAGKRSHIKLALFVLILAALVFAWNQFAPSKYYSPFLWIILGYFAGLTAIIHLLLLKASARGNQPFIRTHMAATAIKLLLTVVFALVFVLFNKEIAVSFLLSFIVMYVAFALFEAVVLTRQLKR